MKHLPNILSASRILMIPFFIHQIVLGNTRTAALILITSGLTDLFDGFLARRFKWVSPLGKILDPAADKLTQVTVCLALAFVMPRYWFFFTFILVKDFVMLLLGGQLVRKGAHFEGAKWFGKVVTLLFYFTMVLILLFPGMPGAAKLILLGVTTLAALFAAVMYIPEYKFYRAETRKDA